MGKEGKKGGWSCSECDGFHNFAFRTECMRCGEAPPKGKAGGRTPSGKAPLSAWLKGPGWAGKAAKKPNAGGGGQPSHTQDEVRCYATMDEATWESVKQYLDQSLRDKVQRAKEPKDPQDAREATRLQDKLAAQLQAATKREAKAVEAARTAMLEVANAKAKVAELSKQLADASKKAAEEFARAAGRGDGESPMQMAKQLRVSLGKGAADDPAAGLLRKLLDLLDPVAPPLPEGAGDDAATIATAGGTAGSEGTQQDDAGMDGEGDLGMAPEEVDAAFDALGMRDMLDKCPNDELRKRLQDSFAGLQRRLKLPRRV